jgi:hypothetical protein
LRLERQAEQCIAAANVSKDSAIRRLERLVDAPDRVATPKRAIGEHHGLSRQAKNRKDERT